MLISEPVHYKQILTYSVIVVAVGPLLARLAEVGVPAGKVRAIDEVYGWDQTASQGLLVDVEHATLGRVTLPGPPLRFFDAEGAEITCRDHTPPPVLDQHATSIREWLEPAD